MKDLKIVNDDILVSNQDISCTTGVEAITQVVDARIKTFRSEFSPLINGFLCDKSGFLGDVNTRGTGMKIENHLSEILEDLETDDIKIEVATIPIDDYSILAKIFITDLSSDTSISRSWVYNVKDGAFSVYSQ